MFGTAREGVSLPDFLELLAPDFCFLKIFPNIFSTLHQIFASQNIPKYNTRLPSLYLAPDFLFSKYLYVAPDLCFSHLFPNILPDFLRKTPSLPRRSLLTVKIFLNYDIFSLFSEYYALYPGKDSPLPLNYVYPNQMTMKNISQIR